MAEKDFDFIDVENKFKERFDGIIKKLNAELKEEYKKGNEEPKLKVELEIDVAKVSELNSSFDNESYKVVYGIKILRDLMKFYEYALLGKGNENYYKFVSSDKDYNYEKAKTLFTLFMTITYDYLILHELCHIYNGHLEIKKYENIDEKLYKVLEWHADEFSISYLVREYTTLKSIKEIQKLLNVNCVENSEEMLKLLIHVITVISSIFNMGKEKNEKDKYHMSMRKRTALNVNSLVCAYNVYNSSDLKFEDYFELMRRSEEFVNNYLNILNKENKWNIKNNIGELNEEGRKEVNELNKIYNEKLPILLKKYSKLMEKEGYIVVSEKSAEETSDNCDDKVKKLEAELEEWKNSYTRKLAEFQNFTKRKENEVAEMRKYASEGIIVKLLDNIDNLERAVDASKESQNFDSLIEGVNMILNNLKNLLTEEGVEEIEAAGKEYDPYEHKAMITENKEELDDNVVVQVFQKGYKMKGKVVRPAMVTVNKKQ